MRMWSEGSQSNKADRIDLQLIQQGQQGSNGREVTLLAQAVAGTNRQ